MEVNMEKVKLLKREIVIGSDFDKINLEKDFFNNPKIKFWMSTAFKMHVIKDLPNILISEKFRNSMYGFSEYIFEPEIMELFLITKESGLTSKIGILTKAKYFSKNINTFFKGKYVDQSIIIGHFIGEDGGIWTADIAYDFGKFEVELDCFPAGEENGWQENDRMSY